MSINELIYYIQLGDKTLYPELWEKIQYRGFNSGSLRAARTKAKKS